MPCNFTKKKLQHSNSCTEITLRQGCSPANLEHIFRTPFYKNNYGGLLLFALSLILDTGRKTMGILQKGDK